MRLKTMLWVVMLTACLGLSEAAAQSNPLAPLLPTQASLSRLKLTRMWWGNSMLNSTRDKLDFLNLDDNLLFAHSSSGILTCFDAETGRRIWSTNLGGADEPAFPPATNDSLVIIPSGSSLIALNKFTGDIVWQFGLPRSPSTAPIMDDTQVYLGTSDDSMMAFQMTELSKFYNRRLTIASSQLAVRWKYSILGHIDYTPIQSGDLISFFGSNRTTYTVSRGRDLKYTFDTPAPVSAGLTSNKGILYICSEDARIFALDVRTGSLRWQTVVGAAIQRTPRVIQDDLFVTPTGYGMFRMRARDGIELWSQPARGVDQFLGASADAVFGSDRAKNLVRLNRATGQIQGRLPLDRFTLRVENDLTDRLYLATPQGTIIALREQGAELPLYFKYPERLPLMPEFAPEEPAAPAEDKAAEDKPAEDKSAEDNSTEAPAAEEKPAN